MMDVDFDPLTADTNIHNLRWWHDFGCDCNPPEFACHAQTCGITPIYASLVPPEYNMLIGSFHAANIAMTQTVIKCAECGKEHLGKDLLVIYQAPLHATNTQLNNPSTKNIIKAVCPEHNRWAGKAYRESYQNVPPTGVGTW